LFWRQLKRYVVKWTTSNRRIELNFIRCLGARGRLSDWRDCALLDLPSHAIHPDAAARLLNPFAAALTLYIHLALD
jgi:hypothetical protein